MKKTVNKSSIYDTSKKMKIAKTGRAFTEKRKLENKEYYEQLKDEGQKHLSLWVDSSLYKKVDKTRNKEKLITLAKTIRFILNDYFKLKVSNK